MDYKKTKELEFNIKIKNKAEEIVKGFLKNVKLDLNQKKGNRFLIRSDGHNAEYVEIGEDSITYIGNFLHEKHSVRIDAAVIFNCIKNGDRGVCFVAPKANVEFNEYAFINKE